MVAAVSNLAGGVFMRTALALLLVATGVHATSYAPARPFIVASPDRSTYARFVPVDAAAGRGHGTVFRLKPDGSESVLWRVEWYSPAVEVSPEGDLIRFAPVPPRNSDLAAAPALMLYRMGDPTPRTYRIGELVPDRSKLECDDDGAYWRALVPEPRWTFGRFHIVTVDGVEISFVPSTGKISGRHALSAGEFSTYGGGPCAQPEGPR